MSILEDQLKQRARELGFDLVGIARATEADGFARLEEWLNNGHAGEMEYMSRHKEARRHPASILPGVQSVVMVGLNYYVPERGEVSHGAVGKVARYARGADYHDVLRPRLRQLLDWLREQIPECEGRAVVDTAPLLERDFARRAGLGWFGKNTMLLNKHLGSYFFLGALLVSASLEPDAVHLASHCGSCTACLTACPTGAFVAPGILDSRRCISYLTIELKGPIPSGLRQPMNDWVFGCDVCQEVCPWNRKAPESTESAFKPRPGLKSLELISLLQLSAEEFQQRFHDSALARPKRRGLLRNAAIALGNCGDRSALDVLAKAEVDPEPLIRDAARWAIQQIQSRLDAAGS